MNAAISGTVGPQGSVSPFGRFRQTREGDDEGTVVEDPQRET
jgi:hypothetical protein